MTALVLRGDALHIPLPDDSVDLIATSPPYWALRSYRDGDEHYDGQLGSEPDPFAFLDVLLEATAEMVRVLKPSGSLWVNLGDKYAERTGPARDGFWKGNQDSSTYRQAPRPRRLKTEGIRAKSLIMIPQRYAIRCIDELGLILRAEVIWCLSGGARVYARTPTGDRPVMLRDLARAHQPEDVQLWNGEKWTQVLGWNKTPDEGALEMELRTGERIGCTPGHRWPTARGVIRADEVRVGDVVQTTRLPEPDQPASAAFLPDDDIGWLVGLYIAEGSRSGRMIQFAGHVKEDARHARLARIAAALDGRCAVYQTGENVATCNLSGSVVAGVIDRYVSVGTAHTKRLTFHAWQRSNAFLAAVIQGYLDGDGAFDAKNGRWRLRFTANDEWAADLRTAAARLGARLSLRRATHHGYDRDWPGWRGEWRWVRSVHHNAKQDGEVVAIRRSRARDFYDVGVADEPHLFALASGVLTHNSKPNGLPESVTDRVRRSHEHLFHFTKEPTYYAAMDEVRETYAPGTAARYAAGYNPRKLDDERPSVNTKLGGDTYGENPLGKLPGSVWSIPAEPLQVPDYFVDDALGWRMMDADPLWRYAWHQVVRAGHRRPIMVRSIDHFAAFPQELPRRIILGWSPPAICTVCGQGRFPVTTSVGLDLSRPQARRAQELAEAGGLTERHFAALLSVGVSDTGRGKATQNGTGKNTPEVYALADHARTVLGGYAREYLLRRPTGFGYACACTPHTDHPERRRRSSTPKREDLTHRPAEDHRGSNTLPPSHEPVREYSLDGWTPPPTRPAVVLDPFGGTGTTAGVADALGRIGIALDLSADYCRLARWRIEQSGHFAKTRERTNRENQGSLL